MWDDLDDYDLEVTFPPKPKSLKARMDEIDEWGWYEEEEEEE